MNFRFDGKDAVRLPRGNGFFIPPERDGNEPPGSGRVYAAIEIPDPEASAGLEEDEVPEPTFFECIDREWVDRPILPNSLDGAPLSILQLDSFKWSGTGQGQAPGSTAWFSIDYEAAHASEADGRIYTNLFGAGTPVRIKGGAEPLPKHWGGNLDAAFLAQHVAEGTHTLFGTKVTRGKWMAALRKLGPTSGVAVYDVGQGACQALLDSRHHVPMLYVDVGGGVLFNSRTYPSTTVGFCTSASPRVVLSHWDWDHWASAARFPNLRDVEWLAPPVPPRPIQQAFAALLLRNRKLTIWADQWPAKLRAGPVRIEKCTGHTSNDSGLAVTFFPKGARGPNCLLPGDASYRFIPSIATEKFNALSMTHHGGKLHGADYPKPKRRAVAVNSAGPRNSYCHPLFGTLEKHLQAGWPMPLQTGFSGQRPCHIFLPWAKGAHLFQGGCYQPDACSTSMARTVPAYAGVVYAKPASIAPTAAKFAPPVPLSTVI